MVTGHVLSFLKGGLISFLVSLMSVRSIYLCNINCSVVPVTDSIFPDYADVVNLSTLIYYLQVSWLQCEVSTNGVRLTCGTQCYYLFTCSNPDSDLNTGGDLNSLYYNPDWVGGIYSGVPTSDGYVFRYPYWYSQRWVCIQVSLLEFTETGMYSDVPTGIHSDGYVFRCPYWYSQ